MSVKFANSIPVRIFPAHSISPLFGSANLSNSLTKVVFPETGGSNNPRSSFRL